MTLLRPWLAYSYNSVQHKQSVKKCTLIAFIMFRHCWPILFCYFNASIKKSQTELKTKNMTEM